jgi:DNA-binding FrmR family transcriptional regulator
MSHTVQNKKPLLARVRRIKGQVAALEAILERGEDCALVLQQIAAVRGAVAGLMTQVIEGHVREHLVNPESLPEDREADTQRLLSVLRSYLK